MCLIVIGWQVDESQPLIVAANRDEFHERPTDAAHWWPEPVGLFAGRDLRSGGTWCGADTCGRVAAVTNVREPGTPTAPCSRGALVADYFAADDDAYSWAVHVAGIGSDYGPFNLLVADRQRLCFVSNRDSGGIRELPPGIWAVSNGHWGEHWPKTERAKRGMAACIETGHADAQSLFALLADAEQAPDAQLPDTGAPREHERFLSPIFIMGADYGTRASTVIRCDSRAAMAFDERGFDHAGQSVHRIHQHWITGST